MPEWLQMAITVGAAFIASSGFWAWIIKKDSQKDARTQLLLGLAHERIISLGMTYIERGWVSKEEYEDYIKYLYAPYSTLGGNGLAERVMKEVGDLPLVQHVPGRAIIGEEDGERK